MDEAKKEAGRPHRRGILIVPTKANATKANRRQDEPDFTGWILSGAGKWDAFAAIEPSSFSILFLRLILSKFSSFSFS